MASFFVVFCFSVGVVMALENERKVFFVTASVVLSLSFSCFVLVLAS